MMDEISKLSEMDDLQKPTIAEYFAGKNIFITGGTGFLGTVLIEHLLSTTPEIGNIYLLIRAKRGFSVESRMQRLLSKAIFIKHSDESKAKVKPIVGELTEKNFGFSDETMEELREKVNIVYHGAATIRFFTYLGDAIKINLIGTQVAIDFSKQLKNLSAFIYLSTAFCNSNRVNQNHGLEILEKVYPSKQDPYEMIKLVDPNNNNGKELELPQQGSPELSQILGDHPNTYTFTKHLAENLINIEMKNYPAGIVRPSIVYGTYKHPEGGWVGSANNGHVGFLAGYTKGLFRTMTGNEKSILDIIPCDYVVNSTLVLSWYVATRKIEQPEVVHCTSGDINPLRLENFCTIVNDVAKHHPNNFIICQPKAKIRNGLRYTVFMYLFHILPALLLWIPESILPVRLPPRKTIDMVQIFDRGVKAFDYFVNKNFHYSTKNAIRILECLEGSNKEDAEYYNYNVKYCEWRDFFVTQIIGMRYYFFKEARETTIWHRLMWYGYGVVQYLWYILGFALLRNLFGLFLSLPLACAVSLLILTFIKWI